MSEDGSYDTHDFLLVDDEASDVVVTTFIGFNEGGFGDNGFGGEETTTIISGSVTEWTDTVDAADAFSLSEDNAVPWTDAVDAVDAFTLTENGSTDWTYTP